MKRSWRLLPKILSGEKTIESRWYSVRCEAWGRVSAGDMIYFKDSGSPVNLRAKVSQVLQFQDLRPSLVSDIVQEYGERIGSSDFDGFYQWAKNKKYCVLIFLKDQEKISPFGINKTGFGSARAFLSVENIDKIKLNAHGVE